MLLELMLLLLVLLLVRNLLLAGCGRTPVAAVAAVAPSCFTAIVGAASNRDRDVPAVARIAVAGGVAFSVAGAGAGVDEWVCRARAAAALAAIFR